MGCNCGKKKITTTQKRIVKTSNNPTEIKNTKTIRRIIRRATH